MCVCACWGRGGSSSPVGFFFKWPLLDLNPERVCPPQCFRCHSVLGERADFSMCSHMTVMKCSPSATQLPQPIPSLIPCVCKRDVPTPWALNEGSPLALRWREQPGTILGRNAAQMSLSALSSAAFLWTVRPGHLAAPATGHKASVILDRSHKHTIVWRTAEA